MAMTADAILFAINSAIRLGRNAQRAYAISLTSRSITLPLPESDQQPNSDKAQEYFDNDDELVGGAQYLTRIEELKDLHHRFKHGMGADMLTTEEDQRYIDYFVKLSSIQRRDNNVEIKEDDNENRIDADELVALLSIRQYTFDKNKHHRPLQMVAGTLVEIGIDYFNRTPGALNDQSASGRAIKHFLHALDDIPFSDNPNLRKHSYKILPKLFISAAETLADISTDITEDPKVQAFIQSAGKGIAEDLFQRLDQLDPDRQEEAVQWGRLLLRSTISNAGEYVFNAPDEVFNTNKGTSKLIRSTGNILLEQILKDPNGLNLKAGFNVDTLDRMMQSTFAVMAEHPRMFIRRPGFEQIVSGVSDALKGYSFRRPDYFPELVRLVLENTGRHLQLFWQKEGEPMAPQVQNAEQLIIQAVQLILAELSQPVDDDNWRPRLSKSQLLGITEDLLDLVVTNPGWIEREVDNKPLLGAVIRATIDALARLPRDQRLSASTFQWLLEVNLRAVAANELVLQKITWADDDTEEMVLQQALSAVFAYVFHRDETTAGDRINLLVDLLDYVLEIIIQRHPDHRGLLLLDLVLFESEGVDFGGGFNRELADALVNAALSALAAHPDLITRKKVLGIVISEIASALDASSFRRSDLMIELVRLSLESLALNAELVIDADTGQPKFLLVVFMRELLLALTTKEEGEDVWQPQLTPAETYLIIDRMTTELIANPNWLIKGPDGQVVFAEVLSAVRNALKTVPAGTKLTPDQLEQLIILAMRTVATSQVVLDKVSWGTDTEEKAILERAFTIVGSFVFNDLKLSGTERIERFVELSDYVLELVLSHHPDSRGLMLIQLILFGEQDIDYSRGIDDAFLTELLESALRVFQLHPNLISKDDAIQAIVSDTAAALDAADLRQPGILPELVRLILENTAVNAHLVIDAHTDQPRFLLVVALRTFLMELSALNTNNRWSPRLSGDSLLLIAENMMDEVVAHPEWLQAGPNQQNTLWQEVVSAVLNGLGELPKGHRLAPETLENILLIALYTTANSPTLLDKIKWADDEQEKVILNKALELIISYVYPPNTDPSPQRTEMFLNLLEFTLDTIISQYPNRRALLLLDLVFFESEVDLAQGFDQELAEELVAAAIEVIHAHPGLITDDAVFRKILRDVAGALRASRVPLKHLLPEIFRLVLRESAGHLETLMNISSPNSPRILLAVAIEQALRVLTRTRRGIWSPSLSEEQLLFTLETIIQRVIENPRWIDDNKLVQVTLEALYTAMGEIRHGHSLPFATVHLLIEAAFDAVGQRRQLVLNFVDAGGGEQKLILEYGLGDIFLKLYDEQGDTSGAWTLTQAETLQTILTHYFMRLAIGPADKATVDKINKVIFDALNNINNNLAFTLDELIEELENV